MEISLKPLKKVSTTVWVIILILIVIRLCLPPAILYGMNWYLGGKLENYQGHAGDFDLSLWRGAYQIQDLRIWKRGHDKSSPLLKVGEIDLSLAWRALLHKEFLGDLIVRNMELTFRDSESDKNKQLGNDEKNWQDVAKKLVPINIESLVIEDSSVHFINKDTRVVVDVYVDDIDAQARNLRNTDNSKELLPSPVAITGKVYSKTPFSFKGRVNLLKSPPVFDIQADLKKFPLKTMNPLFLVYGPFTFESGDFTFYSEVAANEKKIKGYFKPFLENVKMTSPGEKYVSFRQALNEFLLGGGNLIFKNSEDTAATRIDFEGDMTQPGIHTWRAVWLSLKNAFGEPLRAALDRTISIDQVPIEKASGKK